MITYIIADDDEMQLDFVQMHLAHLPDLQCLAACNNAFATREKTLELQPLLLILDVEMPGLSGLQLAKSLKYPPAIIFITSHTQFAVDAFDLEALDYIVKPVSPERLLRAIDKARALFSNRVNTMETEEVFKSDEDAFFVRDNHLFIRIAYANVRYIESSGNFSLIHTQAGEKQLVLANLSKVEAKLPASRFVRISRSFIINKQHVNAINNEIVVVGGQELSISKRLAAQVMNEIVGENAIKRG